MLAIRAYLLVDYQVNAEATPDSFPPAHGTRPIAIVDSSASSFFPHTTNNDKLVEQRYHVEG